MAQSGGSISGTAVAAATVGGLLIYAALRDVTPVQALRDVTSGKPPSVTNAGVSVVPAAQSIASAAIGAIGRQQSSADSQTALASGGHPEISSAARKYLGRPYRWGAAGPDSFDCSGLVTYVLVHDIGLKNLPSSTHTVTGQFLFWRGAVTVKGPPVAGDLICWTGHIAIASGGNRMIEAPGAGKSVRETTLRTAGATIRRVILAQTGNPTPRGKGEPF